MHHLAVIFEEERIRDLHRAHLGDAADIVAAEIEQHQVLGALLLVGEQAFRVGAVLGGGRAARAGAGDRPDRDLAVAHPDQDLRRGADDLEILEVEIAEERRRD